MFPPFFAYRYLSDDIVWGDHSVSIQNKVNWSQVKVNDVIDVDLSHSGLTVKHESNVKLYIREACMALATFLKDKAYKVRMITGCPGVGKSVEVFSCTWWMAKKLRLIYVHGDLKDGIHVIFKKSKASAEVEVGHIRRLSPEPNSLLNFIENLIMNKAVDLIVLDGAIPWLIQQVYFLIDEHKAVVLITCTSYQCLAGMNTELLVKVADRNDFEMDSWTLEEYTSAIAKEALTIDPNTSLSEIFYYAGGCIRLLQLSVKQVKSILSKKILQCRDISKLVGKGGVGDSSEDAVNTLMATSRGCRTILSQYVTRMLLEKVSDGFLRTARLTLPDNPSWLGWIFEYEILCLAGSRKEIVFTDKKGTNHHWDNHLGGGSMIIFKDSAEKRLAETGHRGWLRPLQWNHSGFDAIYRISEHKISFLQITSAAWHSCNLEYLLPYVNAMKAHVVDFIFICGEKNFPIFKYEEPKRHIVQILEDLLKKHRKESDKKRKRVVVSPDEILSFSVLCFRNMEQLPI